MIHPTAIIHPQARLHPTVQVGPHTVIDAHVEIGADCVLGPNAYFTGVTIIGARNRFHAGCVIGDAPQDLKYRDEPTRLRIGNDNFFREYVTVHRSNKLAEDTVLGSHNFLMACAHVGHNCLLGDHVIIGNGALLAGHVVIQDRAFLSGTALVHQFVRVGTQSLMQGGAAISKDLPPYTIAAGTNTICGLNIIGLRRTGFTAAERLELKQAYRVLFRSRQPRAQAVAEARARFTTPAATRLIEFVSQSKRGCCADRGRRREAADED